MSHAVTTAELQPGRSWLFRLAHGADLLPALQGLVVEHQVRLAMFSVIGAVSRARIAYYDQSAQTYGEVGLDQPLEIISCTANVSTRDGQPFVHAHLVLADEEGRAYGGHLVEGTIIFAAEAYLQELRGAELVREPDAQTGLSLWKPSAGGA